MELFNSYQGRGRYYCDITPVTDYLDPIARIRCFKCNCVVGVSYDCTDLVISNGLINCNDEALWNCNLCGNDLPFWIPFTDGDTFDFQFQQPAYSTTCLHTFFPENLIDGGDPSSVSYEIRLCCNGQALEMTTQMNNAIIEQAYIGEYITNEIDGSIEEHPIQMVRFNLEAIKDYLVLNNLEPCFYFVFRFPKEEGACLPENDVSTYYSEPFKFYPCDKFPYIYNIESTYTYLDCFGSYYGNNFSEGLGAPFVYSNRVRVPGSFEQQSFNITKEQIQTTLKTTATQVCENWLLRTTHLPKPFAKFVVGILAGRDVLIDGVEYQIQGELSRNNETGNQFYLEIPAQNCDCNKSLSCT